MGYIGLPATWPMDRIARAFPVRADRGAHRVLSCSAFLDGISMVVTMGILPTEGRNRLAVVRHFHRAHRGDGAEPPIQSVRAAGHDGQADNGSPGIRSRCFADGGAVLLIWIVPTSSRFCAPDEDGMAVNKPPPPSMWRNCARPPRCSACARPRAARVTYLPPTSARQRRHRRQVARGSNSTSPIPNSASRFRSRSRARRFSGASGRRSKRSRRGNQHLWRIARGESAPRR